MDTSDGSPQQANTLIIDQIPLSSKVQIGYQVSDMLSIDNWVHIDLPRRVHKYGASAEKHVKHGQK